MNLTVSLTGAVKSQATSAPTTPPMHPGSRMLASDRLAVEIMDPADPNRYYRGVRFTPVAAVIRARYDGREFLFHQAQPDPLLDVAGLFAEFDLIGDPPGFSQAAIGEPFVKIGVGALSKTEPSYKFFLQYPVVQLAETRVRWGPQTAEFEQTPAPAVNGFSYRLSAEASVHGRTLLIVWKLTNTGSKVLGTRQYLHNCFIFDNLPVGPNYLVTLPFDFTARKLQAQQRQEGRTVLFSETIPKKKAVNIEIDYPTDYTGANTVEVSHPPTGMSVECETSLPGERIALHAAVNYMCPEQFISLSVSPGQSQQWSRQYNFRIKQRKP